VHRYLLVQSDGDANDPASYFTPVPNDGERLRILGIAPAIVDRLTEFGIGSVFTSRGSRRSSWACVRKPAAFEVGRGGKRAREDQARRRADKRTACTRSDGVARQRVGAPGQREGLPDEQALVFPSRAGHVIMTSGRTYEPDAPAPYWNRRTRQHRRAGSASRASRSRWGSEKDRPRGYAVRTAFCSLNAIDGSGAPRGTPL